MEQHRVPGLSLGVVSEGTVVKMKGYGIANVELGIPAEPTTMYKLGSISKQFIAVGIMSLVEEGKLQIGDEIRSYVRKVPDAWRGITVRHLLTHTSGIVREAPAFDPYKIKSNTELIGSTFELPLLFRPGEAWSYSNVGYFLLAEIIHRVSGKSFDEFLHERVFSRAEMDATRITSVADIIPDRGNSYLWQDGALYNAGDLLAMRPSGAFVSNVVDLVKWDIALQTGSVISSKSREQMEAPVKLNDDSTYPYGFGWELSDVDGHRVVHHGGALWCFRVEFARYVDDGLTVIVLANQRDANARELATRVAGLYMPHLVLPDHVIAALSAAKWLEDFSE
jgi:CubicO group peptidase (beta-lactamase class C family)